MPKKGLNNITLPVYKEIMKELPEIITNDKDVVSKVELREDTSPYLATFPAHVMPTRMVCNIGGNSNVSVFFDYKANKCISSIGEVIPGITISFIPTSMKIRITSASAKISNVTKVDYMLNSGGTGLLNTYDMYNVKEVIKADKDILSQIEVEYDSTNNVTDFIFPISVYPVSFRMGEQYPSSGLLSALYYDTSLNVVDESRTIFNGGLVQIKNDGRVKLRFTGNLSTYKFYNLTYMMKDNAVLFETYCLVNKKGHIVWIAGDDDAYIDHFVVGIFTKDLSKIEIINNNQLSITDPYAEIMSFNYDSNDIVHPYINGQHHLAFQIYVVDLGSFDTPATLADLFDDLNAYLGVSIDADDVVDSFGSLNIIGITKVA